MKNTNYSLPHHLLQARSLRPNKNTHIRRTCRHGIDFKDFSQYIFILPNKVASFNGAEGKENLVETNIVVRKTRLLM